MTETAVSRRSMIALAGATAILAGCKDNSRTTAGPTRDDGIPDSCTSLKILGKYDPWGLEPNLKNWQNSSIGKLPTSLPNFAPAYITLVRISPRKGVFGLEINHASYNAAGYSQGERADLAQSLFSQVSPGAARKHFREIPPRGNNPAGKPFAIYSRHAPAPGPNPVVDLDGFENFGSSQQVEIFVWFDVPAGLSIDPTLLVSFAPFTQSNNGASKNDRFFAREIMGNLPGKLIAIENYFTTFSESDCTFAPDDGKKDKVFAMNIHFNLDGAGPSRLPIPMVIDPDTGNGNGSEP